MGWDWDRILALYGIGPEDKPRKLASSVSLLALFFATLLATLLFPAVDSEIDVKQDIIVEPLIMTRF